jgi:hypothetical protein
VTIYEFIKLKLNDRAEAAWQANFLGGRSENGNQYLLYDLGDFFAEVVYTPDANQINSVQQFKSNEKLQLYCQDVDLSSIM